MRKASRRQERGERLEPMAMIKPWIRPLRTASMVLLGVIIGGVFVPAPVIGEKSPLVPARDAVAITTVFDNYAVDPELATQWGFAAVVVTPAANILFDTGSDGRMLLSNMAKLNIRPKDIHKVVLSHVHLDHLGGLEEFLKANRDVEVYMPASFPDSVRQSITSVDAHYRDITGARQIQERVHTTGEMGARPIEQSLIIETSEGLVVLTGCAHPGIVNVVRRAKEVVPNRPVALVMGGFHLGLASDNELDRLIRDFRRLGVKKVAPSHCSGERARARLQIEYKENYIAGGVGSVLTFR